MKICVFSDVHGNYAALNQMLLEESDADKFYFLGDIFGYFLDQEQIIDCLMQMDNLVAIKGNHDAYYLGGLVDDTVRESKALKYGSSYNNRLNDNQIEFIKRMSDHAKLQIGGLNIAFYHGGSEDYLEQRIYPDTDVPVDEIEGYDYIFTGHTHYQMIREFNAQDCEHITHLINPGSLGQPRDGKGFSYCVFDTDTRKLAFKTVQIDIDELLESVYKAEGESDNYKYLVKKYKG